MSMTTTFARWVRMPVEQLLGELTGALAVEDADDRQDQQPLADGQDRRRQLADGVLLLPDDPLALVDEADGDGVRDPVGRRLVGVEHPVEQPEVALVLLEQGTGQHVAQQQHDADDLVGLDAARDDPLGQVAGVALQAPRRCPSRAPRRSCRRPTWSRPPSPGASWRAAGPTPGSGCAQSCRSFVRCSRRCATSWGSSWSSSVRSRAGKSAVTSSVTLESWSLVIAHHTISSSSPSCRGRSRTRSRTRPSTAGRREVPARARGTCCSRPVRACSTSAMPGPVSRATTCTPRRGWSSSSTTISPEPAKRTMLRATSDTAVAMSVRSVRAEAEARRPAHGRPGGRRRCPRRSRMGMLHLVVAWLPPLHQRLAEPRAEVALEEVTSGVDLPLPTAVSARQREQHGTAPVGRRLDAGRGPGGTPPAAVPASGSAGRRPLRRSSPARPRASGCPDPTTSWASSVSRSRSDSRARAWATADCSSWASRSSSGASAGRQIDDAVLVAPVPVLFPPQRGDDVARRHDRVGLEHPRLDPPGRGEDAHQGLLHEVVGGGAVGHPCGDDPPHHGSERGQLGVRPLRDARLGRSLQPLAPGALPPYAGVVACGRRVSRCRSTRWRTTTGATSRSPASSR